MQWRCKTDLLELWKQIQQECVILINFQLYHATIGTLMYTFLSVKGVQKDIWLVLRPQKQFQQSHVPIFFSVKGIQKDIWLVLGPQTQFQKSHVHMFECERGYKKTFDWS